MYQERSTQMLSTSGQKSPRRAMSAVALAAFARADVLDVESTGEQTCALSRHGEGNHASVLPCRRRSAHASGARRDAGEQLAGLRATHPRRRQRSGRVFFVRGRQRARCGSADAWHRGAAMDARFTRRRALRLCCGEPTRPAYEKANRRAKRRLRLPIGAHCTFYSC